jgi:outer membrane lipoprotein carrier protein
MTRLELQRTTRGNGDLIRTIALVVFLFGAVPIAAEEAVAPEVAKALVDDFIVGVTTLASRFQQTLMDANGDVLEVSSGTLEINRPGQFRWAYDQPYEQWLVADGLNIWSYDVDLAQVTVKPQAEALANTPALLLGGSESAMDQFAFDDSYSDGGLTWVRMHPVDKDSGFSRLELAFSERTLARMLFFDNLEQTTLVSLADTIVNEPIDPSHFEFVAPDGVDVVGTPAKSETDLP